VSKAFHIARLREAQEDLSGHVPFVAKVENVPLQTKVPAQQCKPAVNPYSLRF
jgi:hypothetical protein